MTSPRKLSGSFEGGEPFITLSGPDTICVKASFATPGYNKVQKWGRSGLYMYVYIYFSLVPRPHPLFNVTRRKV